MSLFATWKAPNTTILAQMSEPITTVTVNSGFYRSGRIYFGLVGNFIASRICGTWRWHNIFLWHKMQNILNRFPNAAQLAFAFLQAEIYAIIPAAYPIGSPLHAVLAYFIIFSTATLTFLPGSIFFPIARLHPSFRCRPYTRILCISQKLFNESCIRFSCVQQTFPRIIRWSVQLHGK